MRFQICTIGISYKTPFRRAGHKYVVHVPTRIHKQHNHKYAATIAKHYSVVNNHPLMWLTDS